MVPPSNSRPATTIISKKKITFFYFPQGKKAEKKDTFAKIAKKKQIKKTRKNEEMRQKRTNVFAEKEALRESRRVEKQVAYMTYKWNCWLV